ncbi:MAG: 16S rRNA (cytidine(1402)-2'-O)-methyltransferase [Candidatus Cloacimonadota bacterium]|nr:MAG: 16S rRNA (cytidine(1402)-2'-O)-methyltransferase [Candidatus Cloacimonadota bacterium]
MSNSKSKLYVVATPIGNYDDITLRAVNVLKEADLIIMEERKSGHRLLRHLGIKKDFELLNEHNEKEQTYALFQKLLYGNISAALISDAGTPLLADPGNNLVHVCNQNGIQVIPVPGPSSIMTALMASGLHMQNFLYYGFLPAKKEDRQEALKKIAYTPYDLIFLDTPYRLKQVLNDMKTVLGKNREVIVCYKLTMPEEKILWGNLEEMCFMTSELPKGEFVILLKKYKKKKKIFRY